MIIPIQHQQKHPHQTPLMTAITSAVFHLSNSRSREPSLRQSVMSKNKKHKHTHKHTRTQTQTHTHTPTRTRTHAQNTHTHIEKHKRKKTYTHKNKRTNTNTHTHTPTHKTHTEKRKHNEDAHTHTQKHTRMPILPAVLNGSPPDPAPKRLFCHSFETIVRPSPPKHAHFTTVLP